MRLQFIGLTCAFVAVLRGLELPDGADVVRQSLRTADVHTFEYESDVAVEMDLPGATKTMAMSSRLASKPPNRMLIESRSEMGNMRLVSDGEFVWTWLSFLNQYTRRSAASGALDELRNFGFGTGSAAEAALARARTLRRDQIVTGGISRDCWVVEIPFERYPLPVPPGSELRNGSMQLWIDSITHAALRSDTSGSMHAPGMPQPVKVRQSMVVRSIRMGVEIPDTVFGFEPPAGSTHVASFGRPTPAVNLTGKPMPAFSVTTTDGIQYDLARLQGRVILLDFWTTWCEPCRSEIKALDALHREYADYGLVVLGISVGEERETVVRFLRRNPVSYPIALMDVSLAASLGAAGYPTHVVIDRAGMVAAHLTGSTMRERILEVLSKAGLNGSR